MKKAKHWYDYLWICAILYFTLGFIIPQDKAFFCDEVTLRQIFI